VPKQNSRGESRPGRPRHELPINESVAAAKSPFGNFPIAEKFPGSGKHTPISEGVGEAVTSQSWYRLYGGNGREINKIYDVLFNCYLAAE
jgi:hypothetical protein